MTSAQVTAAGSVVLFLLCAALLAWMGSAAGTVFALACTATVGRFTVDRR
jgi:hypothetical protein